jgi:rubredoxin
MKSKKLSQYAKEQGVKYATVWNRYLSHWAYALIKDKLIRLGETEGFCVSEVPNEFRSQRCSSCGWVRKANRKGKTFKCSSCGFTHDADMNAASNLELDLFEVPFWVRLKKMNREGFFWKPDGLFSESQEILVPDAQKHFSIER